MLSIPSRIIIHTIIIIAGIILNSIGLLIVFAVVVVILVYIVY